MNCELTSDHFVVVRIFFVLFEKNFQLETVCRLEHYIGVFEVCLNQNGAFLSVFV